MIIFWGFWIYMHFVYKIYCSYSTQLAALYYMYIATKNKILQCNGMQYIYLKVSFKTANLLEIGFIPAKQL